MHSFQFFGGFAVLPLAHCVAFGGPAPTIIESIKEAANGWTPKPTQGPSIAEIRLRQTVETLDAGFNTCGWIGTDTAVGNFSSPVYCSSGRTCALYTSSNIGMAGCCSGSDSQNCGWAKSCVNYDAYTKKSCDADCETNSFIWKCSNSATPYCVTWTYPDVGVADYACATFNSGVLTVLQTAEDDISFYWKTLSTLSGNAVTGFDETISSSVETAATSDSSDISQDVTTTDTSGSGATDKPIIPEPKPTKKSTPVGVIVGAVVGGLVVLLLIGAAIIFFCMRQRKKKQLANNQSMVAAQQANQAPQSEYKPPVQQQYAPSPAVIQPPPHNGYFAANDQKHNYQPQVQEQVLQSPVTSHPSTPAPAYVQPYYAGAAHAPPMPAEGATQYPAHQVTPGMHEVGSQQASQVSHASPTQQPNVFEMSSGK